MPIKSGRGAVRITRRGGNAKLWARTHPPPVPRHAHATRRSLRIGECEVLDIDKTEFDAGEPGHGNEDATKDKRPTCPRGLGGPGGRPSGNNSTCSFTGAGRVFAGKAIGKWQKK
eukprot:4532431-Pyramimonas_sp.AAC.1